MFQDQQGPGSAAVDNSLLGAVTWVDLGILGVAVFAGIISVWAIVTQRLVARRQATLQLLAESEADMDLINCRKKFIQLANQDGGLGKFGEQDQLWTEEAMAIRTVLNELELISIGIQRGIIDYDFVERWNKSTIISYYRHALPFITRVRENSKIDTYYQEVQVLYDWLHGGKPPKRRRIMPLIF